MTTNTKLADLPVKWRADAMADDERARDMGRTIIARQWFRGCANQGRLAADELEYALSRQDAQRMCRACGGAGGYRWYEADGSERGEKCDECNGSGEAQPEQQGAGSAIDAVISSALALIRGSEEFETADGLVNAAQLHLWHALEDAIERVGPAEVISHANRQPVGQDAAYEMGAKGAPATEAERLLFEAWMRGHCWALSATWDGKTYLSDAEQGGMLCPRAMTTRRLWAAWRDRAALTAPPAQVDLEQFRRPLRVARTSMEWARNDEAVAECDRLLALIDQQAGGEG